MNGNVGDLKWFTIDADKWKSVDKTSEMLKVTIEGDNYHPDGQVDVFENVLLMNTPSNMDLPAADLSTAFNSDKTVTVTNNGNTGAIYVTLTTLAQGRFVNNGFLLPGGASFDIEFVSILDEIEIDVDLLQSSTRVECANDYVE